MSLQHQNLPLEGGNVVRKYCNDLYETIKKQKISKGYLCHKAAVFQTRVRKKKEKRLLGKVHDACPHCRIPVKDTLLQLLSLNPEALE